MSRASVIVLLLTLGAAIAMVLLVRSPRQGRGHCMPGSAAAIFTDCNAKPAADLDIDKLR
ncbi:MULTISPECIES: hypothetical protein [unclassified Bradyrhizobium]|uniref:hypothetical protein n=1 Tax=unclassified Bradyrhizobium TaxID=2631580 RepID=UPI0028E2EBB1|nr:MULTISPECIES: hypothetical protein [unclassified Bradyrhizobium]